MLARNISHTVETKPFIISITLVQMKITINIELSVGSYILKLVGLWILTIQLYNKIIIEVLFKKLLLYKRFIDYKLKSYK